jgi:hypothetical protein
MSDDPSERLFSYGTLQLPEVQRATFGRVLAGRQDAIVGFRLETLSITDPDVIAASGSDRHPVLIAIDSSSSCHPSREGSSAWPHWS